MFFLLSRLAWIVIQPTSLVLILMVFAFLAGFRRLGWFGRSCLALAILLLLVGGYTNLGQIALQPLEQRYARPALPDRVDGIIALGGGLQMDIASARGGYEFNGSGDRYVETLRLARLYPAARIVLAGGSGKLVPDKMSEAESIAAFLVALGVDDKRLLLEDDSRNTEENAGRVRDLVGPQPGETWLLVTSAFHMPRSVALFDKTGFAVLPWPTDYFTTADEQISIALEQPTGNLATSTLALREWLGLLVYWATGRIDSPFPGPDAP